MIHAATSFSHHVAYRKLDSHTLVTTGVYAYVWHHHYDRPEFSQLTGVLTFVRWFRHPSYAGFFYWALGTQLLLQNPGNFIFFAAVLWKFFYDRIRRAYYPWIRMSAPTDSVKQPRKVLSSTFSGNRTLITGNEWEQKSHSFRRQFRLFHILLLVNNGLYL